MKGPGIDSGMIAACDESLSAPSARRRTAAACEMQRWSYLLNSHTRCKFMIRITTYTEAQTAHMILEGKLTGPCVEEVKKCWEQILSSPPPNVIVNLTDLTIIDSRGKDLLAKIHHM